MEFAKRHQSDRDRCLQACIATALSCQQMVHGVFALMNICHDRYSVLALLQRCRQQMVHAVFALMNI
jgi:hypothetical protein